MRCVPLLLALLGCAEDSLSTELGESLPVAGEGAFQAPPPTSSMTLTGPSAVIAGETAIFDVTAPGLVPGDVVEIGYGTVEGSGFCPYRGQTGGSPCLEVTGRVRSLGQAVTIDIGGTPTARLAVPINRGEPYIFVQAFFLNGSNSYTSGVLPLEVQPPWSALDPRVTELEALVAAQAGLIAAQQAALDVADAAIAGLDTRLTNTDEAMRSDITALQSETSVIAGLQADVSTLVSALPNVQSDISMLQSDVSSLPTMQSDIGMLQGQLPTMQSDIGMLQGQLPTMQSDIGMLQGQLPTMQSDIGMLQGQLPTMQSDIGMLQGQLPTMQSDIGMLQGQLPTMQSDISLLQADVSVLPTMQSDINLLQGQLPTMQSDISLLQGDVSVLPTMQSDINALQTDLGTLQTDLGTLQTDLGTLGTDLGTLGTDLGTLGTDLGTLGTDLGTLETDLGTLETDLGTLQAEVDDLAVIEVNEPFRVGNSVYNLYAGPIPNDGTGSSTLDAHYKTSVSCTSEVMWNIEFRGHNYIPGRPIHTESVGYTYSSGGGLFYVSDTDHDNGTTVATTYCSSDSKLSFKLHSTAVWHASDVVINLHGGNSYYADRGADLITIAEVGMRSSNF